MNKKYQEKIEEILNGFDFVKVQKVMKFLDWKYYGEDEIPSIYKLTKMAKDVLESAIRGFIVNKHYGYCYCGGFYAVCFGKEMHLDFHIESYFIDEE